MPPFFIGFLVSLSLSISLLSLFSLSSLSLLSLFSLSSLSLLSLFSLSLFLSPSLSLDRSLNRSGQSFRQLWLLDVPHLPPTHFHVMKQFISELASWCPHRTQGTTSNSDDPFWALRNPSSPFQKYLWPRQPSSPKESWVGPSNLCPFWKKRYNLQGLGLLGMVMEGVATQ